jgi:hypothetical protein
MITTETLPAHAHIVSGAEVVLLKDLPAGVVAAAAVVPDSSGFVSPNRNGAWIHVEHQWPGLITFMDACVRADTVAANRAWNVVETAMRFQRPAGDYEPVLTQRADHLTRTAWWIGQLCRAEIVVTNSPLQELFRWRVTLLLPKLRRSVNWVVAAGDELLGLHASRPDLLMIDAMIFLIADGTFHEPRFAELGQRAMVEALQGQTPDGAFVANRSEVANHARAMVGLLELVTFFPMPTLEDATKRGADWLARNLPAPPKGSRAMLTGEQAELWRNALMVLGYQATRTKDLALRARVERLTRTLGPAVLSGNPATESPR